MAVGKENIELVSMAENESKVYIIWSLLERS